MLLKKVLNQKIDTVIWIHCMRKNLMEDKGMMRRRGPILVGTPKGTSHW